MGSETVLPDRTWRSEFHRNWRSEVTEALGEWTHWGYKDRDPRTTVTSIISSSADFFFFSLDWPELWDDSFLLTAPSAVFNALGPRTLLEEQDGVFTTDLNLSPLPSCIWRTTCTKRPADLSDFCHATSPSRPLMPPLGLRFAARADLKVWVPRPLMLTASRPVNENHLVGSSPVQKLRVVWGLELNGKGKNKSANKSFTFVWNVSFKYLNKNGKLVAVEKPPGLSNSPTRVEAWKSFQTEIINQSGRGRETRGNCRKGLYTQQMNTTSRVICKNRQTTYDLWKKRAISKNIFILGIREHMSKARTA